MAYVVLGIAGDDVVTADVVVDPVEVVDTVLLVGLADDDELVVRVDVDAVLPDRCVSLLLCRASLHQMRTQQQSHLERQSGRPLRRRQLHANAVSLPHFSSRMQRPTHHQ